MPSALTGIEIVAIGNELLSGATIDTNAAHMARELEPIGLRLVRKTTVGDSREAIMDAVASALDRTGVVITTGGLGPTADDATKEAVAELFGRGLEFRVELWDELKRRYPAGLHIPETNRTQAEVPEGAEVFSNPRGTAPGLAIEDEKRLCILLPGVPGEMKVILEASVIPFLAQRVAGSAERAFRRELRTAGIAEAAIAERVADQLDDLPLEVAYLPEVDGVDIRLTYWGTVEEDAKPALDMAVVRLREILGLHIYAEGRTDLAKAVGDLLRERGLTLTLAESCTAGLIAARLTQWPGASDYLWGAMVVYDDRAKIELLGLPEATLRRFGAVSAETASAMAEGARRRSGAQTSLAVTGIAGPTGGSEDKPVGTVWLAVDFDGQTMLKRRHYAGTRDMIRARAAQGGLDLLRRTILGGIQ